MTNYFAYNANSDVPDDAFRISPSQVSRFFDDTPNWYREMLLGEEGFTGNTSTHLGTAVHAAAEMYVKENTIHYDQINSYIDSLPSDIDKSFIYEQYPGMIDVLLSQYLINNKPSQTELFLSTEIVPNVYAAGTLDSITGSYVSSSNLKGDTIVDYKTTSSKSPPNKISRPYWFQQLTYAYIARKHGYNINRIRLVFITTNEMNRYSEKTGNRLKDYPSQVSVVNYGITDTDMEIIENTLKLIGESVTLWNDNAELRFILAQDYRLKPTTKRKFFTKKE